MGLDYILKAEPTRFVDRVVVGCEKEKGAKDGDSKILVSAMEGQSCRELRRGD